MAGVDLFVFRENAETVSGRELGGRWLKSLSNVRRGHAAPVLDALLLAGQVECALSDCDRASASKAQQITDFVASCFVGEEWEEPTTLGPLASDVAADLPEQLRIAPPEGFAYYGLHPGDFVDAVTNLGTRGPVAVVGIRSIGTTLSAVAVAALKRKSLAASRITVRPLGHPYDRRTELNAPQKAWARKQNLQQAIFLVVDEGPGLSGSSFLSTAECLTLEGIPAERILLIGTRDVDPEQLCASQASARWRRFQWKRVSSRISQRFQHSIRLSGGLWRELLLSGRAEHPACWPEMDALKYVSQDRRDLFKFEGFGDGGHDVRERGRALHKAAFGPSVQDAGDGMSCYRFAPGIPLTRLDLSTEVLERIAQYCAFRVLEFRSHAPASGIVEEAVRFNYSQETGEECPVADGVFRCPCPLICDGRMAPHEWIRCRDGRLLKVDGCKDGDDHFLPGPTDIAWDLAGAIIEWDMERDAQQYFLRRFAANSGVSTGNVPAFLLSYSLLRACFCKMACAGTGVQTEKPRLAAAYRFYRAKVDQSVRALWSSEMV